MTANATKKGDRLRIALAVLIGSVWIFHGLYSKILDGVPRHRMIVGRVLGDQVSPVATRVIGAGEVLIGLWVWSGQKRRLCAALQTVGLITMNLLEVMLASDLLISPLGMLALNAIFLSLVWIWASKPVER